VETKYYAENVQHICRHEEKLLIINNVLYKECEYCDENYFTAKVLKKIDRNLRKYISPANGLQKDLPCR